VEFLLPSSFVINNNNFDIQSIKANFNQDEWLNIQQNMPFKISYDSPGLKKIKFEVKLTNGQTYQLTSEINIKLKSGEVSLRGNNQVNDITSTLAYQGYSESQPHEGKGEYQIFLDTQDGVLDKPIFLLDGFDPGDGRTIEDLYNILGYQGGNLIDDFRAQGYDVVLLNFPVYNRGNDIIDGGTDYIQRNAYVFIELINLINQQKQGTHPNIVIGPSMGGLISRYALRYMEMNSMTHDTGLWFSFDSPHRGANVPIGLQHLLNFVAYGQNNADIQELVDGLLRNPAAKQMLLDHADGHIQSGSTYVFDPNITLPTGAPNYRNVFQNELNVIGYPQNTRKVTISNGSGASQLTGTAGMKILDWTYYPDGPSGFTRALIETWFTPAAGNTIRTSRIRGQAWVLFWITASTDEAFSQSAAGVGGLDSAPGGFYDIADLAGGGGTGNPIFDDFLDNLLIDKFNFIPNLSSLGITNINNWNASTTVGQVTNFDAAFIPAVNEPHVTITPQNLAFILNEINALSSQNFSISQEVLITNQSAGITVHAFQNTIDNIQIYDVLGRKISHFEAVSSAEKSLDLSHLNHQPIIVKVQLQNGVEKTFKTMVR
jgi:pimeloyl-ACP methyl ester carboxylesterase